MFSSLADAILVSGPLTGHPADQSHLRTVADSVKDVPIFANTGVNIDNVRDIFSLASGVVIGTHFKVDGITWNEVIPIASALHGRGRNPAVTGAWYTALTLPLDRHG